MIYALSDVHGRLDALLAAMEKIDLSGENRLVLLGDYVDGGPQSGRVLCHIRALQGRLGPDKVIALRGNHEQALLDWLVKHDRPHKGLSYGGGLPCGGWLLQDSHNGLQTFRSLVSATSYKIFQKLAARATAEEIDETAARMVLEESGELVKWMKRMPLYFETDSQIFVHAGVDEEAGELWKAGTPDWMFLWKYPPTKGRFYKTVVAGHVGACSKHLADNPKYHGAWHDGMSHYYVDGSTVKSGVVPVLAYDERAGKYHEA